MYEGAGLKLRAYLVDECQHCRLSSNALLVTSSIEDKVYGVQALAAKTASVIFFPFYFMGTQLEVSKYHNHFIQSCFRYLESLDFLIKVVDSLLVCSAQQILIFAYILSFHLI